MRSHSEWWTDDIDASRSPIGCSADCPPDCELPPIAGDVFRRLPLCSRVAVNVAEAVGGLCQSDVAWFLGLHPKTVRRAEASARAKLREAM